MTLLVQIETNKVHETHHSLEFETESIFVLTVLYIHHDKQYTTRKLFY